MSEENKDVPVAAADADKAAEGEKIVPEVKANDAAAKEDGPIEDEEEKDEETIAMEKEIKRVEDEQDDTEPVDMSPDDKTDWAKCDTKERKITMKVRLLREE